MSNLRDSEHFVLLALDNSRERMREQAERIQASMGYLLKRIDAGKTILSSPGEYLAQVTVLETYLARYHAYRECLEEIRADKAGAAQ